MFLSIHKQ